MNDGYSRVKWKTPGFYFQADLVDNTAEWLVSYAILTIFSRLSEHLFPLYVGNKT